MATFFEKNWKTKWQQAIFSNFMIRFLEVTNVIRRMSFLEIKCKTVFIALAEHLISLKQKFLKLLWNRPIQVPPMMVSWFDRKLQVKQHKERLMLENIWSILRLYSYAFKIFCYKKCFVQLSQSKSFKMV